jgi:hypothetical protein
MLQNHLESLERALNAIVRLCHTGKLQHSNDSDLRALERVTENLVAEIDTQEEGERSRV